MNKGIVTIKAWKRPYYLKQVLDGILAAVGNENYDYFISIDYHPATNAESFKIIQDFRNKSKATTVQYTIHSQQQGCAGNMKVCQEYAFTSDKNYDYMIHLEDDTLPGKDMFLWYEWAREKYGDDPDLFAISPFSPNNGRDGIQPKSQVPQSFKTDRFACQGGFLMTRSIHDMIYRNGGIFGIHGCTAKLGVTPPTEFKKHVGRINFGGSWAIPYEHYFLRVEGEKYTIIPYISRCNNIGSKDGVWNPSEKWHIDNVYNEHWIESPEFADIDLLNLSYEDITEFKGHNK